MTLFWLLVLLLVVWIVLAGLVTLGAMTFQSYLYTEPSTGLAWRGPAAASAVMAVVLVWVALDYRSQAREYRIQGYYRPIWDTTSSETVKSYKELLVPDETGKEQLYKLRPGSRGEYHLGGDRAARSLPSLPPKVIALEADGKRSVFEPERDDKGKFFRRKTRGAEEKLRYLDDKGRVMREGELGVLESFRGGLFVANVVLNLLLVAGGFAALWLVARFQWPHALGLAAALALVLLLLVLPQLLSHAGRVAADRAAAKG